MGVGGAMITALNGKAQKADIRDRALLGERYGENMTMAVPETDHHIVISADSHCGADLRDYKPYLEKKYHSDF